MKEKVNIGPLMIYLYEKFGETDTQVCHWEHSQHTTPPLGDVQKFKQSSLFEHKSPRWDSGGNVRQMAAAERVPFKCKSPRGVASIQMSSLVMFIPIGNASNVNVVAGPMKCFRLFFCFLRLIYLFCAFHLAAGKATHP